MWNQLEMTIPCLQCKDKSAMKEECKKGKKFDLYALSFDQNDSFCAFSNLSILIALLSETPGSFCTFPNPSNLIS